MRRPNPRLTGGRTPDLRFEPPYVYDPDDGDDYILRVNGFDPARFEIAHCVHCSRSPGRHPACLVVPRVPEPR